MTIRSPPSAIGKAAVVKVASSGCHGRPLAQALGDTSLWREGSSQVSAVRLPQSRLAIVEHPGTDAERGVENRKRPQRMRKNAGDR